MEPVLLHGSSHIKNPSRKSIHQSFISRSYENLWPSNIHSMGLLQAPPPQPPLLPLPAAHLRRSSSLSCPPANKSSNRTKDHSVIPKKSKSLTKSTRKDEKKSPKRSSVTVIVSSSSSLGPDPNELPKNVTEVFPINSTGKINGNNMTQSLSSLKVVEDPVDMRPGSLLFNIVSPPPSSLPLPTFCLKPKLSCNSTAARINTGATDNLRRLLRLQ